MNGAAPTTTYTPTPPVIGTMNGSPANSQSTSTPAKSEPVPQATPDFIAQLTNSGTAKRIIPVMSEEAISTSARKIMEHEQAKQAPTSAIPGSQQQQATTQEHRDFPFDESELNFYWQEFAALLPQEYRSSAMRMQNMRVKLIDKLTFEVVLDNEYVVKEFMPLKPQIEAHLRKQLRNRQVKMTIRISAATDKKVPIGKVERFQAMAQKNDNLLLLKEEFGLELW